MGTGSGNPLWRFALFLLRGLSILLRPGPVLFIVILVSSFIFLNLLSGEARSFPRFTVHAEAVHCISRPAWMALSERLTSEVVGEIQKVMLSRFPATSIFGDDVEEALSADPISFSPWIESLEVFRKIYPSRYRLELKLRRPVATFVYRNRSFFIDSSGVVITPVDRLDRGQIKVDVPQITDYGRAGAIVLGRPTVNRRLIEGAAVARELSALESVDLPPSFHIVEINVGGYEEGKKARADDVVLYSPENIPILWGRSSMHPEYQGIDPTPRQKAANLKKVFTRRPGLEGVSEINLTQDKVYIRLEGD